MPTITRIEPQKRRPNRRNVHIDGAFAFGCNVNVVARFRLREGMAIDEALRRQIEEGQVQQEAFDQAMRLISGRMQSERELRTKLRRREYGETVVEAVIANLRRQGYVDDERLALDRAAQQANVKKVGRQRAIQELCKAGVARPTAERAAARVYADLDPRAAAVEVATKRAASLRRYDELTARRRLIGFLQRRGFDYETIQHAVARALDREP
jgi:regulatory protein